MSRRFVVEVEVPDLIRDSDYIRATIQHNLDADDVLVAQIWTVRKVEPGTIQGICDEAHAIRNRIEESA